MTMLAPVVGVSSNPLIGMPAAAMQPVPVGRPIVDLAPTPRGLLLCRVNGEWLDRESWASETRLGDVIEWYDVPQDRDTLRSLLQIAVTIAGAYIGGIPGALFSIGGNLLINELLPVQPQLAPQGPGQTGDAFSTSIQGNQARLDQPIWKVCGRQEINPPFACAPYYEFRPKVGEADTQLDNEQYFYALYSVGIGNHDVVAKIGNTPITRFKDIVIARYLAPGVAPSTVLPNVSTANEVSSNILDSGRYVGGFAACAARRKCVSIGVDVSATRGLGKAGSVSLTVSWRVEFREINDFGQVLGPWRVLGTESRTEYTATPQRWSVKYNLTAGSPPLLAAAARVEVRVVRTDVQDKDPTALHELAWIGLRAYHDEAAPLNPYSAHYELVLRATSQLSQTASKDLRLICDGYVRTLAANLTWNAESKTRNPIWWCLDLLTSSTWGIARPTTRIDLQSFYDIAQTAELRQDHFDYTFDKTMNAWDAAQLIARTCRSRIFRRNGVISIARDELADLPVTLFSHRNCKPGIQVTEKLRELRDPDGVIVEYRDHRTGEWTQIECPCDGVTTMARPVIKRLEGIIGAFHAEREGKYEAAVLQYRTRTVQLTTEMHGILPAFMSPVAIQPDVPGYGQTGDITDYDGPSLTASLSELPVFGDEQLYIWLQKDDGGLTSPIAVVPGPGPWDVVLASSPGFVVVYEDGTRERTKFLLGTLSNARETGRVLVIADGGKEAEGAQLYGITAVIDDDRVHTADNALLPSPGEVQDPLGLPDDDTGIDTGGGTLVVPRLLDAYVYATTDSTVYASDLVASISLGSNGLVTYFQNGPGPTSSQPPATTSEWNLYGEIEASKAAEYEVRATVLLAVDGDGPTIFSGDSVGAWLSLGTTREWVVTSQYNSPSSVRQSLRTLLLEIREVATGVVQDSGTIDLWCFFDAGLGGGGA